LRIGKYPVTNHQYRRFVEAGGYQPAADGGRNRWWSEEGWKWRERYDWAEPRYWDERELNRSTQPVVGVSWHDAEAYCNYLTERWRDEGTITADEQVRFPTQAEWEQAARHGAPAPKDAATDYPWRGAFDPWRANTEESGLNQTTPVTMYPDGRTAGGVWDMSGNVWEWTSDLHKWTPDGDARYWLKGGAYWNHAADARVPSGGRDYAWFGEYNGGCRVVVVPLSRSG
jgi:formylglycine-generating enzyme required for sulfatase activity